jgi:hypothetical protein
MPESNFDGSTRTVPKIHTSHHRRKAITVVIAAEPPSGLTSSGVMGLAPVRTGPYLRVYVFTNSINAFLQTYTSQTKWDFGIILGHTIVHELGHLLIPGEAHGNGIMRHNWRYREWQEAQAGTLLFPSNQARVLRQMLQSN